LSPLLRWWRVWFKTLDQLEQKQVMLLMLCLMEPMQSCFQVKLPTEHSQFKLSKLWQGLLLKLNLLTTTDRLSGNEPTTRSMLLLENLWQFQLFRWVLKSAAPLLLCSPQTETWLDLYRNIDLQLRSLLFPLKMEQLKDYAQLMVSDAWEYHPSKVR